MLLKTCAITCISNVHGVYSFVVHVSATHRMVLCIWAGHVVYPSVVHIHDIDLEKYQFEKSLLHA